MDKLFLGDAVASGRGSLRVRRLGIIGPNLITEGSGQRGSMPGGHRANSSTQGRDVAQEGLLPEVGKMEYK